MGLWLIAAPDPRSSAFPVLASIVEDWLFACPPDNDGLISAYRNLKQAVSVAESEGARPRPEVFLITDDYAEAARIHARLRKAACEFVHCDLSLAGVGPISRTPLTRVARIPIRSTGAAGGGAGGGQHDALWAGVLDELCPVPEGMFDEEAVAETPDVEATLEVVSASVDAVASQSAAAHDSADHLAQVLDPEERAALAAGFESLSPRTSPKPPSPSPTLQPLTTPPSTRIQPESDGCGNAGPDEMRLRAFDLAGQDGSDHAAQWPAVERSIRDLLPQSTLLEARPPGIWGAQTALALDRTGRLHVWTLDRQGASWFALRQWVQEHRNLLALSRRDLVFDPEAEVHTHIVFPFPPEMTGKVGEDGNGAAHQALAPSAALLRAPTDNVRLYRLCTFEWNARRGILVIPIL